MPNIFDGLQKLDDNVIIDNIAMLEAVNMGNVIKGYGTTVANKGAKVINSIGGFFGKNPNVKVVEEKKIEDYILEEKNKIVNLNRSQLDHKLIDALKEKVNMDGVQSNDAISAYIINLVADYLNISENLTVAQKADGIYRRYLEKLLSSIQKELGSQNEEEAEKTIKEIEKNVKNISESDKEKLKEVLEIENLTGNEIRNVLMKAGTPALIIGAMSASGFGAFMALTTIIHAVFTTIMGITIPFAVYTGATSALSFILGPAGIAFIAGTTVWQFTKGNKKLKNEILAQLIFASINVYGGSFVPKDEELPSYETNEELLEEIRKRDKEYKKLVEDNNKLQGEVSNLEYECSELMTDIGVYKNIINKESYRRSESKKKILKLKSEKEEVIEKLRELETNVSNLKQEINLENGDRINREIEDLKVLNANYKKEFIDLNDSIEYQEQIIENASKEIDDKTLKIKETELKNVELQKENELLKIKMEDKDNRIQKTEEIRRKEIEEKWKVYYPAFQITNMAIRTATKFSKKEVWEIERALMELHSLKDYKSVSRGKVKYNNQEYEHIGFSLPCGFPTRILYKILSNSDKQVQIEKVYKHNEKFLQ
ncbi:hypothetical protein [Clostridium saccharobutylicum]|uniref:Uncharacterized protein n=2 Tax=Clostridium saccharobutylicum TaxID=169679 RepID=U5MQN0_CLOSA|nr:hypothetical protein [Clostridium saccharobutylicum]AGX43109.1 hypothetical protein CLSA_c21290 [Clostridium saccharobutylicum DSM 13864]AQR90406.1 hypothetical protein CLOSC_21230 [Clostridium saccharobutylicum]AQS00312.1 hypothetical protein CSACC_21300 [Clostridium saccharobutylicum]AQS14295.1 hypothetical protein CLOSACC_21300 [Clostridium saccharobutylicum]MBA2907024.1 hypothetical protein [Clostridium saccharobutylicum]